MKFKTGEKVRVTKKNPWGITDGTIFENVTTLPSWGRYTYYILTDKHGLVGFNKKHLEKS